jgi:hypothetical protein
MSRRARYAIVSLVAVCCLVAVSVVLVVLPREPRLELRTSDPVTVEGETVRVQVLVPRGWSPWKIESIGGALLTCGPPERAAWLPARIRSLLGLGLEEPAGLVVTVGSEVRFVVKPGAFVKQQAFSGKPSAYLTYIRGNRRAFESTCRQIFGSFQLIPGGGK